MRGWPNPSLLPTAQLKAAANAALSNPEISIPGLEYGPDPGYEPLRQHLANWLTKFYGPSDAIDPARICISGGASQNLARTLAVYSDPSYTRNVWMVSPTYYLACRIFEDAGFSGRLRSVPEDDEGIDIDFLGRNMREIEQQALEESNNKPVREIACQELEYPEAFHQIL